LVGTRHFFIIFSQTGAAHRPPSPPPPPPLPIVLDWLAGQLAGFISFPS
jgi:hypothetical protein